MTHNVQLKYSLDQATDRVHMMQKDHDSAKTGYLEQIRKLQVDQWKAASEHTAQVHALTSAKERLARELQHTRQQFRYFLEVVKTTPTSLEKLHLANGGPTTESKVDAERT